MNKTRGQGVMEYALLVGAVILIVVLAIMLLHQGFSQSSTALNLSTVSPTA